MLSVSEGFGGVQWRITGVRKVRISAKAVAEGVGSRKVGRIVMGRHGLETARHRSWEVC